MISCNFLKICSKYKYPYLYLTVYPVSYTHLDVYKRQEEEVYQITTAPEDFSSVREKLEAQGLEFLEAEVQMVPTTYVALDEKGEARMQRLIDMLDDLDDVTNVYHNWDE